MVESGADVVDEWRVRVSRGKVTSGDLGALHEQRRGRFLVEHWHVELVLAVEMQRLAAGDQQGESRTVRAEPFERTHGVEDMLEVVEHQQLVAGSQGADERIEQRLV